ncbi:MAG: hypothetical protein KGH49_00115 [Candidatus Micrarchaeota archaeon]|nr:hypothetical protein [Candidatus Micrarchaeota archaeon]
MLGLETWEMLLREAAYDFGWSKGESAALKFCNESLNSTIKLDMQIAQKDFSFEFFGGANLPKRVLADLKRGTLEGFIETSKAMGNTVAKEKTKRKNSR